MKMDDKKWKHILQEAAEMEADRIMEEVNSDPTMNDVVAPEAIHEKLFQQIREYEATKESTENTLTEEQEELIRLGKKYKKKLSRRKYFVLVAAVVCALAIGTVSFGGAEKVIQEVKDMIAGKTQINIDENGERTREVKVVSEVEAYEEIDEKYGFYPVKLFYLPQGMNFVDMVIEEESQNARMYYENGKEGTICYTMWTGHRTTSIGMDIEDKVVNEYTKQTKGISITIKQYLIEDNGDTRWRAEFLYNDVQYYLLMSGIGEKEVEKIVENLYFS